MDRATRNMQDQGELARIMADIFSQARIYHLPFQEILELREKRVFQSYRWKRAPQRIKSYVLGTWDVHFGYLYQHDLEWRVLLDGQHISGNDVPHDRWADVVPSGGRHFYKGTNVIFDDRD
jgi:hypothetical protein